MMKSFIAGEKNYNFAETWLPNNIEFIYGNNSTLFDKENNSWIDLYANFGSNIFGHSNKEYVENIVKTMKKISSVSMSDTTIKASWYINKYFPSMEKMRFTTAGTLAIEDAIRLSRAYTGKTDIVRFVGHYHGHCDNILGGGYDGVHDYPTPFSGDPRNSLGVINYEKTHYTKLALWNDVDSIKHLFDNYDSIACVIMEPLNMNGGGIPVDLAFLSCVEKLCKENNALIIFDEIITGLRTGLSGYQKLIDFVPDITVLGKAISGGMLPVSVVGGRKKIFDLLENNMVVQAGTFNGYSAGSAAVVATFSLLEENDGMRYKNLIKNGRKLRTIIETESKNLGINIFTQGHDGCFCLHYGDQELAKASDWTKTMQNAEELIQELYFNEKILVSPKCRFYPNTDITDEEFLRFRLATKNVYSKLKETLTQNSFYIGEHYEYFK